MKKILLLCIGLFSGAALAGPQDTNSVQTRSLEVLERIGHIERIDVTAPVDIVEDGYNDKDVMRILAEGETIEIKTAEEK